MTRLPDFDLNARAMAALLKQSSSPAEEPTLDERRAATAELIILSAMVARGEACSVAEARVIRNARRGRK